MLNYSNASSLVQYLVETWKDIKDPIEFEKVSRAAYPKVDLLAEAKKARAWEVSKPERTKIKHKPFLNGWWARQQDKPLLEQKTTGEQLYPHPSTLRNK